MASEIIMTTLGLEEIGDYVEARMRKVLIEYESTKEEKLIDRNEAAEILSCSPDTITRYVNRGILKDYSPTPGRFRFKKSEVINCRKFKNRFR